jgi:hypothetical protein
MSVSCECCVLSGRVLCDGLITRPEESYRLWCVYSVIVKPLKMRRPRPPRGCRAIGKENIKMNLNVRLLCLFNYEIISVCKTQCLDQQINSYQLICTVCVKTVYTALI